MRLPYIRFYFRDHLGDTGHLTAQQHGVYFLLLANYAASGKPLPTDLTSLCRLAHAVTPSEQADVSVVLEFFTKDGDVYRQKRLDAEIDRATRNHDRVCELSAQGVKAREEKRKREFTQAELLAAEDDESPSGEREREPERESPSPQAKAGPPANRTVQPSGSPIIYGQEPHGEPHGCNDSESEQNRLASAAGGGGASVNLGAIAPNPASSNTKSNGKTDDERWKSFIAHTKGELPESLKNAMPKPESIPLILDRCNAMKPPKGYMRAQWLAQDLVDYDERRSPPLSGLKHFRWEKWLDETAVEYDEILNQKDGEK